MVIGFDGSRAFSKNRTGTENYSYQLLVHLAKIDQKNTYKVYLRPGFVIPAKAGIQLTTSLSEVDPRLRGDDKFKWPSNFEFVTINYPRLWTQVGLAFQTFKDNLDLLFVPSHTLPLMRKPGLKTVMTVHDLGAEYLPGMHQLKQRLYLDFITKFQLKSATRLISVSKATKKDLIKKVRVDSKKVEVIYEGVNKEAFKPVKSDLLVNSLNKFSLEKGKYFLFVGTIQPRKNLERLIKAFATLPSLRSGVSRSGNLIKNSYKNEIATSSSTPRNDDRESLKLALVGGKGWLSDEIYELPKKLGIEGQVKFLPPQGGRVGRVDDADLPSLYSGAIGFVFPSLFEGFGLPILEAMSCGCPVIASDSSSLPEVVGEAGILVDPLSEKEIAFAMEKLISNDKLRDNLIKKGEDQANKFSWDKAAKKTLELFKNLR